LQDAAVVALLHPEARVARGVERVDAHVGERAAGFIATNACTRCRMAALPFAIVAAFSITIAVASGTDRLSRAKR
jgi:hypothetical protein